MSYAQTSYSGYVQTEKAPLFPYQPQGSEDGIGLEISRKAISYLSEIADLMRYGEPVGQFEPSISYEMAQGGHQPGGPNTKSPPKSKQNPNWTPKHPPKPPKPHTPSKKGNRDTVRPR